MIIPSADAYVKLRKGTLVLPITQVRWRKTEVAMLIRNVREAGKFSKLYRLFLTIAAPRPRSKSVAGSGTVPYIRIIALECPK
jgi:hypothetical protein